MSVSTAGQQRPHASTEEALNALRRFIDSDPILRGQATVIPAPGSAWERAAPAAQGGYPLLREAELPALIRRLHGVKNSREAAGEAPGEPPTTLATFREEQRQICAIARIVCQVTSEVLAGLRPAQQLQRWLDLEVQQKIEQRASLLADARAHAQISGRRDNRGRSGNRGQKGSHTGADSSGRAGLVVPRPQPLSFGHIRAERVARGAWEVSVVFADATRIRACALRLQAHRRRWRVVAMELG